MLKLTNSDLLHISFELEYWPEYEYVEFISLNTLAILVTSDRMAVGTVLAMY